MREPCLFDDSLLSTPVARQHSRPSRPGPNTIDRSIPCTQTADIESFMHLALMLRCGPVPRAPAIVTRAALAWRPLSTVSRPRRFTRSWSGPRQPEARFLTTMNAGTNFHDTSGCRFGVRIGEDESFVSYYLDKDAGTIDLQHTFTPQALRGQGLAAKVGASALSWACLARVYHTTTESPVAYCN